MILTLPQVLDIFDNLDLMRRTMVLTDAATALRVSEILALMWKDLDFVAQLIRVRRAYVYRRFGAPKSKVLEGPGSWPTAPPTRIVRSSFVCA